MTKTERYEVVRISGETMKARPVRRPIYTNPSKAQARRHHERAITPRGSSDWIIIRTV